MIRSALVLDFDGVISDSAVESFVVALRTYVKLRPDSRLAEHDAALRGATLASIRLDSLFLEFLEMMPLGNRAEDFGVVLSLLEDGLHAEDQLGYDRARIAQPVDFLEAFHAQFYEERAALQCVDRDAWASWIEPYEPLIRCLRSRGSEKALCIATAKDRPSVEILLDRYGLADVFPADRVIDKEYGRSKRAHLSALRERLGLEFSDLTFVDDKFNHLGDVAPLGVRCVLAAWGYNGQREQVLAQEAGYRVCAIDQIPECLFESEGDGVD